MRTTLSLVTMVAALAGATPSLGNGLVHVLGLEGVLGHRGRSGCGCKVNCGCGPVSGCKPVCRCPDGLVVDGRKFAGKEWLDCCDAGPRLCPCTDAHGHCVGRGAATAHGACCKPTCGCGPVAGCGPVGGCGHKLGRVGKDWFGSGLLAAVGNCLTGCSGCDSEFYWSEWHNDPPMCCDSCDCHGNWVGPPAGGYRAPYDHPYAVHAPLHQGHPGGGYYMNPRPSQSNATPAAARRSMRPIPASSQRTVPASGRVVRKPPVGPSSTYQR